MILPLISILPNPKSPHHLLLYTLSTDMAVDVCSEISTLVSPRISFSYDLNQSDSIPADCSNIRPDSTSDFKFSIASNAFLQQLSSADELFYNGKILPTQIKQITQPHKHDASESKTPDDDSKKKRLKELLFENRQEEGETEKPISKSFWQFRRSSSLNCDYGRSAGFIKSLQNLSRSKSTGSASNQKENKIPKVYRKQNSCKEPVFMRRYSSASSNSSKRPPLKNNCRANGTGIKISPILNITHGTVCFFGFGSLFCNGKSKKKRK